MKKRTFLLLEVLIALFLVAFCFVPLVRQPTQMFKNEITKLKTMENERLADWAFSEVKELFIKNQIPWEKIPRRFEETGPFPLPNKKLHLPGCKEEAVACHFILKGQGAKVGKNGEDLRHVYIRIFFGEDEKYYEYRLPMQKLSPLK